MKLILTILFFPCFAAGAESGPAQADRLFSKGLYQEALTAYSEAAARPGDDGLKALYRAAECEGLLSRYGEAVGRLDGLELPADPLWRGRFLLLRAETGRQFLARYGYALPSDEQKGTADVTKLTRAQWQRRIAADYDALWDLRRELAKYPLEAQGYFVDVKGAELAYTPTLWDFAVLRWTDYLLSSPEGEGALPEAALFAEPDYRADYSAAAPAAVKAAAILEDAAHAPRPAADFAGEHWKLARLLIPFEHAGKVSRADPLKLRARALATLNSWVGSFKTPQARAWAAYRAASLNNEKPDHKAAVELCKKTEALAPGSKPAVLASRLRAEIELPRLEIAASFAPPPGEGTLKVTARNLPTVYFRAYKTSPDELTAIGNAGEPGWGRVRYLGGDPVRNFLRRKADLRWEARFSYPAAYGYKEQQVASPAFKKGLYVIAASGDADFADGSSLIKAVTVNITDIFLLGTSGIAGDPEDFIYDPAAPARKAAADIFRLYAVNALTGRPLAGAAIDAFVSGSYSQWEKVSLKTDASGVAAFGRPLTVAYPSSQYFSIDPLLSRGGAYAYWNSYNSAGFSVPQPVNIYVETDRPVYRPGQEVRFKVTALLREPRGLRTYDGAAKIKITVRDPNWQDVYTQVLPVTGLGSAAGVFPVPQGRLLGRYSVNAELAEYGQNFSASAGFGVEEYKRPEFEAKLAEAKLPWRYGQKAEVAGTVNYYFGSPVPGAAVKYRVTRSRYIPWYCWYWAWNYAPDGPSETAAGEVKTGDDGRFSFSFTPQPESDAYAAYPASYLLEIEARDAGGRTITDSRSYRAGGKAYLFDVTPEAGFFTPENPAGLLARLMDINDVQQAGRAEYSLYRLEKAPAEEAAAPQWGSFGQNPSLEQVFSRVPDGPRVDGGQVSFSREAGSKIKLKALAPGAYRLRLRTKDPWGGESESQLVLVSASPEGALNAGLKLPPVALFERASYQAGETARVLIGASALKGVKYVEVLAGDFVLARQPLPDGGLSLFSVKVGREHRGGFGLRWLGAADFKVYSAMAGADVPLKDKDISLSIDHAATLAPGQKVSWLLTARDSAGRPAAGEALVKIFDRSLEYYGKEDGFWGDGLYPARPSSGEGRGSLFTPYVTDLPVRIGVIERMMRAFRAGTAQERLAALRVTSSSLRGYSARSGGKSVAFEEDGAPQMMMAGAAANMADVAAPEAAPGGALASAGQGKTKGPAPAEPKARADFSETAYYEPQLKVVDGKGSISFTIPERLTAWKITSYLLTRDAKRGSFSAETVTKKDLMVRLDIPRFFREGDVSRLTAVVTNGTAGELSGEVSLTLTRDGADALDSFGVKGAPLPFIVKGGGTTALYWEMTAPPGAGVYKVRAVARAGRLSDAQENDLPLLPSRERLIASGVAALDGSVTKRFSLPELEAPDASREVEALHLEIQPQLMLTVLNSLPFLVTYPYECTEQVLNRYVPLAITNSFYAKYPALRAAAAKLPKRDTLTPPWERDNPARLMSLMETPWELESRGRKTGLPVADMLDPKVVAAQKQNAIDKLKAYQNSDGSFPWFPGGQPNLYMTLYVLEGLAEASRYGVEVPQDMVGKAVGYALAELPAHMKPEEDQTSLILYAAYVLTSFPASSEDGKAALAYARVWADYADKHADAMTAFGKAYAAYVYLRLGEKAKADSYLARAMDGARTDAVSGVYWTPEKISWLWYNDTVEKHAFILRTLLVLRPGDPKIAGLTRWLLFNRKANEWKSTRASAAAIYSLLDVMKAKGALDKGETFGLKWGATAETVVLRPFDWVAKPLRWSRYGPGLTGADLSPTVKKKGPGLAYAAFTGIYTTNKTAEESPVGMMNVSRRYFLRVKEGEAYTLKPLSSGDTVAVGDQIEVHLAVNTRSQFEYVHIKDPKPAGFEAEELNSGWRWDGLSRYEEPRDSLTNFFVEWLPHGEYELKYRLRPTTPGTFRLGAAVMQSMYAPEFAAHSAGMVINVK